MTNTDIMTVPKNNSQSITNEDKIDFINKAIHIDTKTININDFCISIKNYSSFPINTINELSHEAENKLLIHDEVNLENIPIRPLGRCSNQEIRSIESICSKIDSDATCLELCIGCFTALDYCASIPFIATYLLLRKNQELFLSCIKNYNINTCEKEFLRIAQCFGTCPCYVFSIPELVICYKLCTQGTIPSLSNVITPLVPCFITFCVGALSYNFSVIQDNRRSIIENELLQLSSIHTHSDIDTYLYINADQSLKGQSIKSITIKNEKKPYHNSKLFLYIHNFIFENAKDISLFKFMKDDFIIYLFQKNFKSGIFACLKNYISEIFTQNLKSASKNQGNFFKQETFCKFFILTKTVKELNKGENSNKRFYEVKMDLTVKYKRLNTELEAFKNTLASLKQIQEKVIKSPANKINFTDNECIEDTNKNIIEEALNNTNHVVNLLKNPCVILVQEKLPLDYFTPAVTDQFLKNREGLDAIKKILSDILKCFHIEFSKISKSLLDILKSKIEALQHRIMVKNTTDLKKSNIYLQEIISVLKVFLENATHKYKNLSLDDKEYKINIIEQCIQDTISKLNIIYQVIPFCEKQALTQTDITSFNEINEQSEENKEASVIAKNHKLIQISGKLRKYSEEAKEIKRLTSQIIKDFTEESITLITLSSVVCVGQEKTSDIKKPASDIVITTQPRNIGSVMQSNV